MNLDEFLGSLKNTQLCKEYKNKFINKYTAYLEKEKLERQQFIHDRGISEEDFFLHEYSDYWDYEWFYVGNDIETFYTKLGLDFGQLASTKEILFDFDSECYYKNYIIQDMWNQLEKLQNDEEFCFGIYVFSTILRSNEKQDILKNDLQVLLKEILVFRTEELVPSEKILFQYIKENHGFFVYLAISK